MEDREAEVVAMGIAVLFGIASAGWFLAWVMQ
jgi:hypothetical protein